MTLEELEKLEAEATKGPWTLTSELSLETMSSDKYYEISEIDQYQSYIGENDAQLIIALRNKAPALLKLWKMTKYLLGPNQIGKTVDTSIKWAGAIETIMTGQALWDLKQLLEELEKE